MVIQKVIRGIGGIAHRDADLILANGMSCNWWRQVGVLSTADISSRLTETNLEWHQNRFLDPDPNFSNAPFRDNSPFISTTAGCLERDHSTLTNIRHNAWFDALSFATDDWRRDGYLFYSYLFVLSKQSIKHQNFAEELRELNIYHHYSDYHFEGEITAKIIIPSVQIERWEFYDLATITSALGGSTLPRPNFTQLNSNYELPDNISNIRELI